MDIPQIITDLLKAQEDFDSTAYSNCFSENASVFDEGKIYEGKGEIMRWNENTNAEYKTRLKPIEYKTIDEGSIMTTVVSGDFPGSPITLNYHFQIVGGKIQFLKVSI